MLTLLTNGDEFSLVTFFGLVISLGARGDSDRNPCVSGIARRLYWDKVECTLEFLVSLGISIRFVDY